MEVIKIGNQQSMVSKNGGSFEFDLIKEEVKDIDCNDYMIIVNGCGNESEILASKKKKIFIVTDSFAFNENKESIEKCDVILHQSKDGLSFINKKQYFSHVPFLFFSENEKINNQSDGIIFGGANTRREDKFGKYLFDKRESLRPNIVAFVKKYCPETGKVLYDDRIDYESFCQMLRYFKYTICFSREEYDELQWVTPRYIEAISRFVFPFTDDKYAVYGDLQSYQKRVDSYYEMINHTIFMKEDERLAKLKEMQTIAKKYKGEFKNLVLSIIG